MQIKGQIHAINPTEQVSPKFSKREFVVKYSDDPKYPQFVLFQMTQDKCGILDGYKVGDDVEVNFNLRGREYNGQNGVRYFNSLECWRIVNLQAEHTNYGRANDAPSFDDDLPY